MFRAWCATQGAEVLLSPRRIRGIRMTETELEIHYTCWCGTEGHLVDRRARTPAPVATPAQPLPEPAAA